VLEIELVLCMISCARSWQGGRYKKMNDEVEEESMRDVREIEGEKIE
jgi:hypothetical protein